VLRNGLCTIRYVRGGINQTELFKTLEDNTASGRAGFPPDMPTVDALATVKWNTLTHLSECSLIQLFFFTTNKGYHSKLPRTLAEKLIAYGKRSSSKTDAWADNSYFFFQIRSKPHFV